MFIEIPQYKFIKLSNKPLRRGVLLLGDLKYYSKILKSEVVVFEGFKSDGASVPQRFWDSFPPFGEYLESAIIHDLYCVLGKQGKSPIDFKMAAKVFKEAMETQGVNWWKRTKMYLAVRFFGPRFKAVK